MVEGRMQLLELHHSHGVDQLLQKNAVRSLMPTSARRSAQAIPGL